MTDSILFSHTGHVCHLLLNCPEQHNALGRVQLDEIQRGLDQIENDPEVRVLLLTGAGEKTFCAGASLRELDASNADAAGFQLMTARVAKLKVPTICAVNGDLYGGGVELAASCDMRIGVRGSRMRVPAAELGLCYPLEGIYRFLECLGPALTRRILMGAEEFDADGMLKIGFLDHLVERADLQRSAQEMTQRLVSLAPLAVSAMKQIIRQAGDYSVDPATAETLFRRCLESEDFQEGLAAKREKRSPIFAAR